MDVDQNSPDKFHFIPRCEVLSKSVV